MRLQISERTQVPLMWGTEWERSSCAKMLSTYCSHYSESSDHFGDSELTLPVAE